MLSNGQIAENGYEALSDLDSIASGGNGDGVLTKRDSKFKNLALWLNINQNGISEPGEVKKLNKHKILQIDTQYDFSPEVDEFGNLLPFHGLAVRKQNGVNEIIHTTDVFFRINNP